jgi:soluble lytic murein transglycosylase-like protein
MKTIITVTLMWIAVIILFMSGTAILSEAKASASNPVPSPVPSPKHFVAKASQKPEVKSAPLPKAADEYLWKKSRESGFSYYLLLALAKQESNLDITCVSSTGDYGLLQINKRTAKGIAAELGLKRYNLMDYKTSIDFSLYHLSGLRAYWGKKGYKGKRLERMLLLSYHRGVAGARGYVKKHGRKNAYVQNIENYKTQYEREAILL